MAKPANRLDKFVTYTYHFELYMGRDWETIKSLGPATGPTTRFNGVENLLINTRMDAHQTIDDVSFDVIGPGMTAGVIPTPITRLNMVVKEPGGFSFIEKLQNRMEEIDVSMISDAVFGLRVVFVGRPADIQAPPQTIYLPIIPLSLVTISGEFLPEGGVYQLRFISMETLGSELAGDLGSNYSFTPKNLSFEAKTVKQALSLLEERLNKNYEDVYSTKLNNNGSSKSVKYKIIASDDLTGDVDGVSRNSFASGDDRNFSFSPTQSIPTMINNILLASPELCKKIGATREAMEKSMHEGAFMPVVTPKVNAKDDVVEVVFLVSVYKGGGDKLEFEYFFADAGQNVDVHNYNIVFNNIAAFLAANSKSGTDANANFSAKLPGQDPKRLRNSLHEPITQNDLPYKPVERRDIDKKSGDVAVTSAVTRSEVTGLNSTSFTDVAPLRSAREAIATYLGSINPTQSIVIRGHLQVLELCIGSSDDYDQNRFISGGGLWIKVNIYMPDGAGGKKQFYYDDYYNVHRVTNTFSGGVFTQQITMMMADVV